MISHPSGMRKRFRISGNIPQSRRFSNILIYILPEKRVRNRKNASEDLKIGKERLLLSEYLRTRGDFRDIMIERVIIEGSPFAAADPAGVDWPRRGVWPAKWISPAAGEGPRFTLFACRCRFERPVETRLHLASDSVCRLWIDGVFAGSGPEQGDRNHTYFDTRLWKAAAGEHVIAVLVADSGGIGPFSQMGFRHGMLLAAEGGGCGELLNTGVGPWRAAAVPGLGFRPAFPWARSAGPELVFDYAGWPEGVTRGENLEFGGVVAGEPGADPEQRNEFLPAPMLCPASLPPMLELPVRGIRAVFAGAWRDRRFRMAECRKEELPRWQSLLDGGKLAVPPRSRVKALLALDDYYCAQPELVLSGGAGAELSVGWCEGLFDEDVEAHGAKGDRREWRERYFSGVYDHFRSDGRARQEFFTIDYRAGRFVSIEVATAEEPLEIERLAFHENRYPVEFLSRFEGGGGEFRQCARLARRTLEMCSHDTFMDCPFYERLMYVGDTRIQALITMAAGRDARLVEKALELFASGQLASGLVQSRYPSRITQIIPTFTPYFVGMVLDYAKWRGGPRTREWFRAALRGVDAFERWIGADGLLSIGRGWNFVDWTGWPNGVPPQADSGVSGILNAQYLYTLEMAAELCGLAEEPELAARYRRKKQELAERFAGAFWRPEAGLFSDVREGEVFSEHAQVFALLSHALEPETAARCAENLFRRPDLTRATVYFTFYLFEVFREFRRPDLLVERLGVFFDMTRLGLATMLEAPEPSRSDCHAWSAHPLYHFWTTLLGVRPAGAGFRCVEVAPQPGPLGRVAGMVVHPGGGEIEVECDFSGARVTLPGGLSGRFIAPDGGTFELGPGENRFRF